MGKHRETLAEMALLTTVILGITACSRTEDGAWFSEEASVRGLNFVHQSGFTGRHLVPQIVSGGAALADVDGDGDLDAYLVQGGEIPSTEANVADRLYLNRGDGYFDEAPADSGTDDPGYGMGVAAGDYDNDGDVDLYVTNYGPNVLLRNDGTGRFEDVSLAAGVDDPRWSAAATFLDLDADGDLDLFVVNYMNWTPGIEQDCFVRGVPTYCGPTIYNVPAMDRLYRNNGDGTFTDITFAAGINVAFGNGLGTVGADFNDDGLTDLFVANDMMVNQLWLNQGNLRFKDESLLWGVALDEHGVAKAGMGVAAADYDDDDDTDLLVVNLKEQTDSFFRNEGKYFVDVTREVGLAAPSVRHTRFGVALADFNNDGSLDLYEANGRIESSNPAVANFDEPNLLFKGTRDGKRFHFDQVTPQGGVSAPLIHTSRGLAVGDVNDDGGLDLLIINKDATPYLLMNQATRGQWVRFRVLTSSGRDAYGASVSAMVGTVQMRRDVQPSASYLASSDPRVHFGMGDQAGIKDVVVTWPGGEQERFGDFQAGETYALSRGKGKIFSAH
ncbi:MAG TPA: hypothetical protein DCM54_05095 [Gammaproteobacteria bacterium]|nr:hypothetical protein [Gammaproteobacteria bacterium]